MLGGGIPVRFENQVIGAIGVAGAGGAQNDNQCASKAIETVLTHKELHHMTKSFIALSSLFIASATFAQTNPLSVHVLNLETGLPSSQVEVVLEKNTNNQWVKLNQQVTDSNGRITALYPKNKN